MVVIPRDHPALMRRILSGIARLGFDVVNVLLVVRCGVCGHEVAMSTHEGQEELTTWEE